MVHSKIAPYERVCPNKLSGSSTDLISLTFILLAE